MTGKIEARKEGSIGHIVFNNPERHNAMSLAMWEETTRILESFAADDDIRVLILTGAGEKAFISGADISKFDEERASLDAAARYASATESAFSALENFRKPAIAKIHGFCLGGGLALALCCDIRLAGEGARFAIPAAKLGIGYDYGGIKRLIDTAGASFTKEILFTARQFSAQEALAMGLVNRVLPDAALAGVCDEYAATIAANAPLTIAAAKVMVREALRDESARDLALAEGMLERCFESADYAEGRTAFLQKRKPLFTGH